jgi:hypothetical protein
MHPRDLLQYPRRLAASLYGPLLALYVAGVIAVAYVLIGQGRNGEYIPSGELAPMLLWGNGALSGDGVVLHGHGSLIGVPHPGPLYPWTLWAGSRIGNWFGLSGYEGAVLLYHLLVVTVAAVAGASFTLAARRRLPGVVVFTAILLWTTSVQVSPPELAYVAYCWAAGAVLATLLRRPWGVVHLAGAASVLTQVYMETAPLGVPLLLAAGVHAYRSGSGLPRRSAVAIVAGTVAIGAARVVHEGFDLPLRYVRGSLRTREQLGGGGQEFLDSVSTFTGVRGGWLALGAGLVAVCLVTAFRACKPVLATASVFFGYLFVYGGLCLVAGNDTQDVMFLAAPVLLCGFAAHLWSSAGRVVRAVAAVVLFAGIATPILHGTQYVEELTKRSVLAQPPLVVPYSTTGAPGAIADTPVAILRTPSGMISGVRVFTNATGAWPLLADLLANGVDACLVEFADPVDLAEQLQYRPSAQVPTRYWCPPDITDRALVAVTTADDPRVAGAVIEPLETRTGTTTLIAAWWVRPDDGRAIVDRFYPPAAGQPGVE